MGELKKPQILTFSEESTDLTLFDCRWVPCSTRFVVAGNLPKGHGVLRVYTMGETEGMKVLATMERDKHPIKCITFGATSIADRQPATGDFEGKIDVWDLENKCSIWQVKGHTSMVNAIDGVGGGALTSSSTDIGAPELVTGSRDGSVKVWDVRIKDKPVACMQPGEGAQTRECWGVAFGNASTPNDRMVAAGFDNGDIKVFDLRTMSLHWETHVSNGVCSVAFDRPDIPMNKLSATCLEGRIHMWDLRTKHPKEGYAEWTDRIEKQHHTIWGGRFLRQNREIFVTMGGGGEITLWKYSYPEGGRSKKHTKDNMQMGVAGKLEKLQNNQIAEQPISGFDWSPDKTGLALTTAFDQKIRLIIVTKLSTV